MSLNNKEKETRKVTFEEDYFSDPGKAKKEEPIYRKGSVHAIHYSIVNKLEKKGVKMKVEKFDFEKLKEDARKEFAKNKAKERAYA